MTDLFTARNGQAWDNLLDEIGYPGVLQKWFWGEYEHLQGRGVDRLVGREGDGSWWMAQSWGPSRLPVRWTPEGPISLGQNAPESLGLEPRKLLIALLGAPLPPPWGGAVPAGPPLRWPRFHASNVVVDLSIPEQDLIARQHQKWRNRLRLALRSDSKVSQLGYEESVRFLKAEIFQLEERKNFRSPWTLKKLRLLWDSAPGVYASAVENGGRLVAVQLVVYSGRAAMLISSLVTESGRSLSAGHLLRWDAFTYLKSKNVRFFNLGGVDKEKDPGVATFKIRCGGHSFDMPGTFLVAAAPPLRAVLSVGIDLSRMTLYDETPFDFVDPGSEESSYPALFKRFLDQLPKSSVVLDVGCGPGRDLAGAVARRKTTFGIDQSLFSVKRARRFAPVVCADATRLPVRSRSANGVILDGVAHHTKDPFGCLGEAARVLVPGGSLYFAAYKNRGYYPLVYRFPGVLFRWLARAPFGRRGLNRFAVPLYGWLHRARRRVHRSPEAIRNLFADYFLTPIASFHSRAEVEAWARACGMALKEYDRFPSGNCHLFVFEKPPSP